MCNRGIGRVVAMQCWRLLIIRDLVIPPFADRHVTPSCNAWPLAASINLPFVSGVYCTDPQQFAAFTTWQIETGRQFEGVLSSVIWTDMVRPKLNWYGMGARNYSRLNTIEKLAKNAYLGFGIYQEINSNRKVLTTASIKLVLLLVLVITD